MAWLHLATRPHSKDNNGPRSRLPKMTDAYAFQHKRRPSRLPRAFSSRDPPPITHLSIPFALTSGPHLLNSGSRMDAVHCFPGMLHSVHTHVKTRDCPRTFENNILLQGPGLISSLFARLGLQRQLTGASQAVAMATRFVALLFKRAYGQRALSPRRTLPDKARTPGAHRYPDQALNPILNSLVSIKKINVRRGNIDSRVSITLKEMNSYPLVALTFRWPVLLICHLSDVSAAKGSMPNLVHKTPL
ncbi:hypothetical protein RRG08_049977 [Elysia crispata]|uniref:Uncharacterized protein n=1 Tax=Elysia crispata TaxID=231223 RepID=A0AAE1B9K5_9GAST|nr:hypothetical protein RRG08_049977 [Elysia crispata]